MRQTTGWIILVAAAAVPLWCQPSRARPQSDRAAPTLGVSSVAFSPDGKTLACGCLGEWKKGGAEVRLWRTASWEETRALRTRLDHVMTVAYSPDGALLAVGGAAVRAGAGVGEIELWDPETGAAKRTVGLPEAPVDHVAFGPGGRLLAAAANGSARGGVWLWDLRMEEPGRRLGSHSDRCTGVAFRPDGEMLASAGGGGDPDGFFRPGELYLWDVRSGRQIRAFRGIDDRLDCIAFSPDGTTIATGGYDQVVRLWEPEGRESRALPRHFAHVDCVAFSPDGARLASSSGGDNAGALLGELRVWDTASGRRLWGLKDDDYSIASVAYSPDGRLLAAAGNYGIVRILDAATGRKLRSVLAAR